MVFFLDRVEPETSAEPPGKQQVKHVSRELQVEVHLSPVEFKSIAQWMAAHVKQFEDTFGEKVFPKPEEKPMVT